jgi:hypothetical protein
LWRHWSAIRRAVSLFRHGTLPISLADFEATEEKSANLVARFSREIKPVLVGLAHLADFEA